MGSPATEALLIVALCGRFSNIITACITLDRLLGKAWKGWSGRHSLVELLPLALVDAHDIENVQHLCFGLDECLKHISKDATLGNGQAIARHGGTDSGHENLVRRLDRCAP
jgi:hypothetical protein